MRNPIGGPKVLIDASILVLQSWCLYMEACVVIGMRLTKFTTWDAKAQKEADLMVAEKIGAAIELQWRAINGRLGTTPSSAMSKSIAHYRKAVASNRRRLTKAHAYKDR